MKPQFTPAQVIISQAEYNHLKREARRVNVVDEKESTKLLKETIWALLAESSGGFLESRMSHCKDILKKKYNIDLGYRSMSTTGKMPGIEDIIITR